jgi:hypothetical protein
MLTAVFARDYNAIHSTNITFVQEAPAEDPSCDYLFQDSASRRALKVQLTRAAGEGASIEEERVRPDSIAKLFISPLSAQLRELRPAGYSVSVQVDGQFPSKEVAGRIAQMTAHAVMSVLRMQPHTANSLVAEFDRRDIDQLYEPIKPFIANLEVRRTDPDQPLLVAWSPSRAETLWNGGLVPRVLLAANKKAAALGSGARDLVLLVWSDNWPVAAFDAEEVRHALAEMDWPFLEVWLLDCWGDGSGSAHCVWMRG